MAGETDLKTLLAAMSADLDPEVYVFASLPDETSPKDLRPRMAFVEREGLTLILSRQDAADAGIEFEFPSRMITLSIHSSLEAVGFMAAIASALAENGISVNPVSAFFHDHLFVPEARADEAMQVLADLCRNALAPAAHRTGD